MKIYFVTKNKMKSNEALSFFEHFEVKRQLNLELCIVEKQLHELLDPDINIIVRQKTLEAYEYLGLPCIVEHGGLYLDALPGLLGGIGQIVWNAVGDRMCDFLRPEDTRNAFARSVIGYCDGKQVSIYPGETRGQVTERSRGNYRLNWDPIFVPDGSDQTHGEMGPELKRATSPSVKALNKFLTAKFDWKPELSLTK